MRAVFTKNGSQSSVKLRKIEIDEGADRIAPVARGRRRDDSPPAPNSHFAAFPLRPRAAALDRIRSIWPRGRVTQISPIHSSFTPLIGLALKLVRLTMVADFPRSTVFR